MIRKIFSEKQYHWMMNLPHRVMYTHKWIDTQHKMWFPRWGLSNKQIEDAQKRADELYKSIKWDTND
jgi:hypothetical protein